MARILGIDHGEARIGLALSDELEMLAHPLETVPGEDEAAAVRRIREIVDREGIRTVVLGMPYRMDGTEGPAVRKVRSFRAELEAGLPAGTEIVEVDERLSTVTAQEKLRAAGRDVRRSRGMIDQAAAVEILQDYLNGRAPLGEFGIEDDEAWADDE